VVKTVIAVISDTPFQKPLSIVYIVKRSPRFA